MRAEDLIVKHVLVNQATSFKRIKCRARGRADRIHRRNNHTTVVLGEMDRGTKTPEQGEDAGVVGVVNGDGDLAGGGRAVTQAAVVALPPGPDRAVHIEGQGVTEATGDGEDVGERAGGGLVEDRVGIGP